MLSSFESDELEFVLPTAYGVLNLAFLEGVLMLALTSLDAWNELMILAEN